jgi:hypothetical protein
MFGKKFLPVLGKKLPKQLLNKKGQIFTQKLKFKKSTNLGLQINTTNHVWKEFILVKM